MHVCVSRSISLSLSLNSFTCIYLGICTHIHIFVSDIYVYSVLCTKVITEIIFLQFQKSPLPQTSERPPYQFSLQQSNVWTTFLRRGRAQRKHMGGGSGKSAVHPARHEYEYVHRDGGFKAPWFGHALLTRRRAGGQDATNFTRTSKVTGIILGMGSANERRRYTVTPPLIGWFHTQNDL